MSGNENPTPSQILAALRDHGVDIKTYKNWDTIGRPWNYDGGGLRAVINHHTATPSATGSSGCPSLGWCATAYDKPASNAIIGRGPGDTYLLSAGSCWHSGDGGPFPAIGIKQAANVGHFRMWGNEIDDAGLKYGTLTDYQIENVARIDAALTDLCGWPKDGSRIITHQAWTDGSYGVNPNGPSPYLGRKGDTLHKNWGEYPGSKVAENYNPIFWREQVAKYLKDAKPAMWDGTIPLMRIAAKAAADPEVKNKAAWRLACRLYDLGYMKQKPAKLGEQGYPTEAVVAARKAFGWNTDKTVPSDRLWSRVFGMKKP